MVKILIIKKPVITERSADDAARGIFTFKVDITANKYQIRRAIEKMFSVHVVRIATVISKGKMRLVGKKRVKVKETDTKTAKVKLVQGEKIDLFEVAQTK